MKTDFLILGGGVAGLSAANYLAEAGVHVALLEGGNYPSHKICGEFISPEALPLLSKWGIDPPIKINQLKLVTSRTEWHMDLPDQAASFARYFLDDVLAKRARNKGAILQVNAQIIHIEFPKSLGQPYIVSLSSGEKWMAPVLLISTGRLVNSLLGQQAPPRYIGVKAHFEGIRIQELIMYMAKGAYFGVSPIDHNRVNVAGIIACSSDENQEPRTTFESVLNSPGLEPLSRILASGTMVFDDWLVGTVPEFGVRLQPKWPGVYFLGDAAGVIPPATGDGLAMGLTSGVLAAACALKGQDNLYRKYWNSEYSGRISRGMILHRMFLSSKWVNAIPAITRFLPFLPRYCFNATRGTSKFST